MSRDSNSEEQQNVSTDNEDTPNKEVSMVSSSSTDPRKTWSPMPSPLPARSPFWQWIVTWVLFLGLAGIVIVNNAGYRFTILDALFPSPTEPVATEPAATEPAATEPAATEPAATEPAVTEPATTEPATTEPVATETPNALSSPACSTFKRNLNFLADDLTLTYFVFPRDTCIHLQRTEESRDLGKGVGNYIKIKVWVWVKNGIIQNENMLTIIGKEQCFFERPIGEVPSSEFTLLDKPILVEVTGNNESEYKEIIITGWINEEFLRDPTPTPSP